MRALVDWSYALLSEPERIPFRRLSVLAGGWTLDAAEIVCSGVGIESEDVLGLLLQLVDRSLVLADEQRDPQGGAVETRYRLLETLRQYAAEKLYDDGEEAATRTNHVRWCLQLVEGAAAIPSGPGGAAHARRLEAEHDNLRAALRWSLTEAGSLATLLASQRLAGELWRFWWMRSYLTGGYRWLEASLAITEPADDAGRQARATLAAGASMVAMARREYERSVDWATEMPALSRPEEAPFRTAAALRCALGDKDFLAARTVERGMRTG